MERKQVLVVSKKACPVCMLVKAELERHADVVSARSVWNVDEEGRRVIAESGLHDAPIVVCDGKYYSGKGALAFASGLGRQEVREG